jgi:hypothetical protein
VGHRPDSSLQCRVFPATQAPGAFAPCSSSTAHSASGLSPGTFAFEVRATDAVGNVDPTPAKRTVIIAAPGTLGGGGGIDKHHDGVFAGQDCNDDNAAIRPGAQEVKGNRIDENCDGTADPFPTLAAGLVTNWSVKGSRLTLSGMQISQALPKGFKAEIRCAGKHCPFKRKTLKGRTRHKLLNVFGSLSAGQRTFRTKQTLEVWVGAPGFNTKVLRLALKAGKVPVTVPLCVPPGATKPQPSCL